MARRASADKHQQQTLKSSFTSTKSAANPSLKSTKSGPTKPRKPSANLKDSRKVTQVKDEASDDDDIVIQETSATTAKNYNAQDKLQDLDPNSSRWNSSYKRVLKERAYPKYIHENPDTNSKAHQILHNFDNTMRFGPTVGITRLERWERAHVLGLEPPTDVRDILLTNQGVKDRTFRESVYAI